MKEWGRRGFNGVNFGPVLIPRPAHRYSAATTCGRYHGGAQRLAQFGTGTCPDRDPQRTESRQKVVIMVGRKRSNAKRAGEK